MVQYPLMKSTVVVTCMVLSFPALAARVEVSSLPSPYADTEAATNLPLRVSAATLQSLTLSVPFDSCVTNEVLVAVGADGDGDGDLSLDEAALAYGCDCGAWYRADLRTGAASAADGSGLSFSRDEFDPSWNLVKVIRRGLAEVGESVSVDVEKVRFDIRIR